MYIMKNKNEDQAIVDVRLTTNHVIPSGEEMTIIVDSDKKHLFEGEMLCRLSPTKHLFIVRDRRGHCCQRHEKENMGVSLASYLFGRRGMKRLDKSNLEDYSLQAFKEGTGRFARIDLYADPVEGTITRSLFVKEAEEEDRKKRQKLSQKRPEDLTRAEAKFLKLDYDLIHRKTNKANVPTLSEATGMETIEIGDIGSNKNPTEVERVIARKVAFQKELDDLVSVAESVKSRPKGSKCSCAWCDEDFVKPMSTAAYCSSRDKPKAGMADVPNCRELFNGKVVRLRSSIDKLQKEEDAMLKENVLKARSKEAHDKVVQMVEDCYVSHYFYDSALDKQIISLYEEYRSVVLQKEKGTALTFGEMRQALVRNAHSLSHEEVMAMTDEEVFVKHDAIFNEEEDEEEWEDDEGENNPTSMRFDLSEFIPKAVLKRATDSQIEKAYGIWLNTSDEEDDAKDWELSGDQMGEYLIQAGLISKVQCVRLDLDEIKTFYDLVRLIEDHKPVLGRATMINELVDEVSIATPEFLGTVDDGLLSLAHKLFVDEDISSNEHRLLMISFLEKTGAKDPERFQEMNHMEVEECFDTASDEWFSGGAPEIKAVFKVINGIGFSVEQIQQLINQDEDINPFVTVKGIEFSLFETRQLIGME